MQTSGLEREVVQTTIGDLVCALVEAAEEVTTNSREIELLAFEALRNILDPESAARRRK